MAEFIEFLNAPKLFRQKIAEDGDFQKLFSAVPALGTVFFYQPAVRGFIFVLVGVVRVFHIF